MIPRQRWDSNPQQAHHLLPLFKSGSSSSQITAMVGLRLALPHILNSHFFLAGTGTFVLPLAIVYLLCHFYIPLCHKPHTETHFISGSLINKSMSARYNLYLYVVAKHIHSGSSTSIPFSSVGI